MKYYYEFKDQEYYALIVVTGDSAGINVNTHEEAAKIYVQEVAGDTLEGVLAEGAPWRTSEEKAFFRVMHDKNIGDDKVKKALEEFHSKENGVLLIDASLIL